MKSIILKWKSKQWKEPFRFLYKGFGLTMWKWYGILLPLCALHFGNINWYIGWGLFHNGVGLQIWLSPKFIIEICMKGQIGWWYKKGLFNIIIMKYQWKY